jgi:TRAP-type C4-dicarboxylate transport system permease large subunit
MLIILHIIAIITTGLFVLYADEEALQYVLGKKQTLNKKVTQFLHYAVALGLAVIIITGGLLYSENAQRYLSDPTFVIKMIALAALIINSYFLEKLSVRATQQSFASQSKSTQKVFFISGSVSLVGWVTAVACGLLL